MLRRKTFYLENYNCATLNCDQEETLQRLFWTCPFAIQCWNFICPTRRINLSSLDHIQDIRDKLQLAFAMDIIIIAAWSIWITRNNKIFKNISPTLNHWKDIYFSEIKLLTYRMKKKLAQDYNTWLHLVLQSRWLFPLGFYNFPFIFSLSLFFLPDSWPVFLRLSLIPGLSQACCNSVYF